MSAIDTDKNTTAHLMRFKLTLMHKGSRHNTVVHNALCSCIGAHRLLSGFGFTNEQADNLMHSCLDGHDMASGNTDDFHCQMLPVKTG